MMFSNFRLSEIIFNLMKNLIESGVSLEIDNYLYERNRGHLGKFVSCAICKEFLGNNLLDDIKYFTCNHIYHKICFFKEADGDECPICKRNDCMPHR